MKFKISQEIFAKWPEAKIGAVVALGVNNQKAPEILALLRQQEQQTQKELSGKIISQLPEAAAWRQTYKDFGVTGNKYVSSVEALLKRVSKGGQLPDINPLVNLYNALSLKYKMPFGGEDLDKVKGDIVLKIAAGNETGRFIGSTETSICEPGEVAYCDELGFICRRWNWREADRTKLDQNTTNVILVVEAIPPLTETQLKQALEEISQLVEKYLGGKTQVEVLSQNKPEWSIDFTSGKNAVEEKYQVVETVKPVKKVVKPVKVRSESVSFGLVIKKAIEKVMGKDVNFSVEHPENIAWGDYSTNAGIITSKPQEICAQLKTDKTLAKIASKIEIAGAGFINISIKNDALITQTNKLLKGGKTPLRQGFGGARKIMVEFTDPNPFKEFHIGHLFSNIVGESLARLFASQGAELKRACYQGDVGMHVAKAVWGMMKKNWQSIVDKPLADRIKFMGQAYALGATAYEDQSADGEAAKKEMEDLNKKIYALDESIRELYQTGRGWSLEYFEMLYQRLGTKFDYYFFERDVGGIGLKLVKEYLKKGIFVKSQGAVIFPGSKYGLHDRVFINKLGLPTYEAKDLGLALAKFEKYPYDQSVIVTSNEINEYFKVVLTGRQFRAVSAVYLRKSAKRAGEGWPTRNILAGLQGCSLLQPRRRNLTPDAVPL